MLLAVNRRQLLDWARTGLGTIAAQTAIQALGFGAGVLIIRFLSSREYACYTIATAGLGMLTVLTDGGIGNSVLALGGAVWQDPVRLGVVIATGIRLRRQFSRFSLALGIPLLVLLLHRQGAGWSKSLLVALSIVPVFLATVTGHLLETVPRLHQNLRSLQFLQLTAAVGRLLLTLAVTPLWPLAVLANLMTAMPQWWLNLRLRAMVDHRVDWRGPGASDVSARMMAQVRRTLPGAIYYALSGQLYVWLASLFGKADNVAAVGALSRPALLLTILSVAFNATAVPRFARIPRDLGHRIRGRYFQSQLVLLLVCLAFVAVLAVYPEPVLSILGPKYAGLHLELVLMILAGTTATVGGGAYALGAARGVIAPPSITLPCNILLQLVLIVLLPLNTIAGVLWVAILSGLGQWLVYMAYFEWHSRHEIATSCP